MLGIINQTRGKAGARPVRMGDNIAAQLHAEDMLANCYSGHWDTDGLKPYMRYSLASGYQVNAENVSGLSYCITVNDRGLLGGGYLPIGSIEEELLEVMEGFVNSPGHHRTLVDQDFVKVNIGLAWDRYNVMVVQHFEGEGVEYVQLPEIRGGLLSMYGIIEGGFHFQAKSELGVSLYYDPPPVELTRGQLARTYCYELGPVIAGFRWPLEQGWSYQTNTFQATRPQSCADPYDMPTDTPPPASPASARVSWESARMHVHIPSPPLTVPWVTALRWSTQDDFFIVEVNISSLLRGQGSGVYTVMVSLNEGGGRKFISSYSIFHEVTPPDVYSP